MDEKTIKSRLKLAEYVSLDGEVADAKQIAKSLRNLGDLPRFYTIDELEKAFQSLPQALDLLSKQRNIANLTPVKRQIINKNGVAYVKTVYVKKVDDDEKATSFIKQNEYENQMKVGDVIDAKFKGWSTGDTYQMKGNLKITDIGSDYILAKFIKLFDTGNRNSYTYPEGYQLKLPRTNSNEWNKQMSFHKHIPEVKKKPQSTGLTKVESISQISVGDEVTIKTKSQEIPAKIRYIHPRGEWLELVTNDGKRTRRKLSSIYKGQSEPEDQPPMSWQRKREIEKNHKVIFYVNGVPTDISGYPGEIFEQKREQAYNDRLKDIEFDEKFGKLNFDKLISETQNLLKQSFGDIDTEFDIATGVDSVGDTYLKFEIENDKVRIVRQFYASRRPDKISVYHQYFKIKDDNFKGKGFGKKLFKIWYEQYKNIGVKKIDVSANIDLGGYVWMRYGFMAERDAVERIVQKFKDSVGKTITENPYIGSYTVTQQDADDAEKAFKDFYNNENNRGYGVQFPMRLLSEIGPNKLASKALMYKKHWEGELDLTDDEQRTYFENYIGFSK